VIQIYRTGREKNDRGEYFGNSEIDNYRLTKNSVIRSSMPTNQPTVYIAVIQIYGTRIQENKVIAQQGNVWSIQRYLNDISSINKHRKRYSDRSSRALPAHYYDAGKDTLHRLNTQHASL
jgi:hypothetical protein